MRLLTMRDWLGTVLVVAIVVPYVGFLVRGDMPLIQDPRGMATIALVLGAAAFLVMGIYGVGVLGRAEWGLAFAALGVGVAALLLAETAAAYTLLAVFVAMIVLLWAVKMLDHAGLIRPRTLRFLSHR